jgi:hypothetical protein
MKKRRTLRYAIVLCALASGCAPMSENQCRTANWYQLGEHEGLFGQQPRIDVYSYQCARYQVQPSAQDYMDGWHDGLGERFKRTQIHM